jgi:hypothetical protein
MSVSQGISALWPIFIPQLPVYLALLVGIVLALVFWRRHPTVSLLAVIAFVLLLIVSVVGTFLSAYLPIALQRQGVGTADVGYTVGIVNLVGSVVAGGAWAALLVAFFIGRRRA